MSTDEREAFLAEVREREQAATKGPWRWRGNVDFRDPYLTGAGSDVLGNIPCEITREEADRLVSTDCLPEPEVELLPAETYGQRYDAAVEALRQAEIGRYLTDKNGEPEKDERLAFCTDGLYHEARTLAIFEVAPDVRSRADRRVYRADIIGIRHPDAEFIAQAREDIPRLLAIVDELQRELSAARPDGAA